MNVLSIPDQSNQVIEFSHHSIKRAHQRDVPIPKYVPLNAKLVEYDTKNGDLCLHYTFDYNGVEYTMIINEDNYIVTLYPTYELPINVKLSNAVNKYRITQEDDYFLVEDDYICLDYETEFYLAQTA